VAKYKQGQAFIVLEDSPESAAAVLKELRARFDGAADAKVGDEAFQDKAQYLDGICIFRKGRSCGIRKPAHSRRKLLRRPQNSPRAFRKRPSADNTPNWGVATKHCIFYVYGGDDGARTRDLCRDRAAL
jgi:hypothetical protein